MQAYGYLIWGPTPSSFDGGGCCRWIGQSPLGNSRCWRRFAASATISGRRNHYDVLGVLPNASPSDIKKAYRLLALKYHPDVNKEVGASEDFKSIRLAYDILIDETTRIEYDRALHHQQSTKRPLVDDWTINPEYEDELRLHRWAYLKRRMQRAEKHWGQYHTNEDQFSFHDEAGEAYEEENLEKERGSFIEVLRSAFISLFLMQTVGIGLSLTFSGIMALIDRKLDTGYKLGYLFAWVMGGRVGILLTMFLSFASWVCGKTSSSVVALVVVAMWFGSNLARYAMIPQGALLTLLYMSIKLQVDLT
ncbi:chaperone protein dnaj [Phtheirospermum japonicum]|uniref:Chaperone protein dnaj n=1 Tax=Phtheirospermum japonicum TaxID=374723 RepID=A0A830B4G4_9LAMI|nr:chaperone protein dnaj [Phtheirospermum japonicum]